MTFAEAIAAGDFEAAEAALEEVLGPPDYAPQVDEWCRRFAELVAEGEFKWADRYATLAILGAAL